MTSVSYFSRSLRVTDEQGQVKIVGDAEILMMGGPIIVLGEPGMGKSELIREIGRRSETQPIMAVRFMHSKDPSRLVVADKPLLIDALDEAVARRDGDAVDLILAQLESAGAPEFILTCRAREWQQRSVNNLKDIYGKQPTVLTIEPLNRSEAILFLTQRHAAVDAEHVLSHLESHNVGELYGNPLTLSLMGQVAEYHAQLPATRAALFEEVCALTWPEHDSDRYDLGLGKLTADQALSAAGAVMAGALLAGSEAVNLAGSALHQDNDVRLADLELLPSAGAVRTIIASKLFQSTGAGRAKPIHRVIAEYLGARWLASEAKTPRAHRRLLAQFHGAGAVPASLRGLHAWLAFHSVAMAQSVIGTDPIGVLRYGETSNLTSDQADCMLESLNALAELDPYFGSQDWDSYTAKGLMIPHLRAKIEAVISSAGSNAHLRAVLIAGCKQTLLARDLADALESVALSTERFYRERYDAADALMPFRVRPWWQKAVATLCAQGTEDSTRLARELIQKIDCDVSDELLVATLLAEMGITICSLPPTGTGRTINYRSYKRVVSLLPAARLAKVISLLVEHYSLVDTSDWQVCNDFTEVVASLMVRALDEAIVESNDPCILWRWLGVFKRSQNFRHTEQETLKARLAKDSVLRHEIQEYALYSARPRPSIWMSQIDLEERLVGLSESSGDITWFLQRLSGFSNKDHALREDWKELMRMALRNEGFEKILRETSLLFQSGDLQLESYVQKLLNPLSPGLKRKKDRLKIRQDRKKRIAYEETRRHFSLKRNELRAGDFSATYNPARIYLGLGLHHEVLHSERLSTWFGPDLMSDAMSGFEAALHRCDLPSPAEIAQSYAESKRWNYCFVMMAGLIARQRSGIGFADLSKDVQKAGLLMCHDNASMCADLEDVNSLRDSLEQVVIPTSKDREDFARLWIEPSLILRCTHAPGLYLLARNQEWQQTGVVLASDWLIKFPDAPHEVEEQLVDCLNFSGAFESLALVAAARHSMTFRDLDHLFTWLAIDILVRFDEVRNEVSGIGARNPEFIWRLRDLFMVDGHDAKSRISLQQAKWIVSEFRVGWSKLHLHGNGSGNTNPYNATDFLLAMIRRISDDTSVEAVEALHALIASQSDTYTEQIRHLAAEQRQKLAEENFTPIKPRDLGALLTEGPPSNIDDLKSIVLEELLVAQKILNGDDLDQARDFWAESGVPHNENRCRDRLAALISPALQQYGIQRITEADMPNTKRADLAFTYGDLQLPMEVKGQWHSEVWQAATDQLDLKYLIDWRSEQRGIYCVFWFGDLPSSSRRRLQIPQHAVNAPTSAGEMRTMLIQQIPEARRAMIDVVVLDLTAGKPKTAP
ncbi:ATP-binding protein [Pseudomonas chlororaphis]|uniref:ATP-binding protein n=2 Tax=Pseudomonas chlororaphis TaxID=587753 RepID=A0AB34C5U8_9PSED|nr:ATP-binding protein [Pseudomonas chlororaphis]